MSDKRTHPLTDVLSSALANSWGKLPDDTKANVKAAVADIIIRLHEGESALAFIANQPCPEARRNDWLIVYNEQAQVELHCTFRGNTDEEVEQRIAAFLTRHGIALGPKWIGLDEKITNRYEAKAAAQQPQPAQAQDVSTDGTITCPALELVAMPKSDKDPTEFMWKVRTPKSKYPVPMWEEAVIAMTELLTAHDIDPAALFIDNKPAKHQLPGWSAVCTIGDNGFPKKVVQLIAK